jgi:glutamate N-acetyltransferase / amino-acid N-acetyltransferase
MMVLENEGSTMDKGTVVSAKGFLAAGVACGIKQSGKPDLAVLVCPLGATAAAMFTTNKVVSAAVTVCRENTSARKIYGVVINSGNANTCTGTKGLNDARMMCRALASGLKVGPGEVFLASTGIIGHKLPFEKIRAALPAAILNLSDSPRAGMDFTRAIMTTDTRPKTAVRTLRLNGKIVTIAGTTKGAGMIGPNMATTICVLTTDAAVSKLLLGKALQKAIGLSLNRLTVDGHQSTNDTAILLASGASGIPMIRKPGPSYAAFEKSLCEVADDLARQMALDAEGATRMFRVEIEGAASPAEANKAARAVADYDLVKCAIHGGDPNWGRIICAVGSCGVRLNPDRLTCWIGGVCVFRNGQPTRFDPRRVSRIIRQKEHVIRVRLGVGKAADFCYGCDLGYGYVEINAEYHT